MMFDFFPFVTKVVRSNKSSNCEIALEIHITTLTLSGLRLRLSNKIIEDFKTPEITSLMGEIKDLSVGS